MAWRFKASKYKNAAPIVPKPESCVRDITVGSYQTYGNNISASAAFMAFNWDHAGSSLAVLPIDDCGRKSKTMPLLHAHSDTVTDIDFSPFHDGILATGSQDCLVKIWHVPERGLDEPMSNPECTFSHKQRRVETVGFHPTADFLLYSTSFTTLTLWDIVSQKELFSNSDHSEVIQSIGWKRDGTLLVTSCKDKKLRVVDPRIEKPCVKTCDSHQSIKDSRVVWLGDNNKVLSTGFDAARLRQVIVRDLRSFDEPEKTLELDCSTGILIPLYDADTGMLFLAGKGDTTISYLEVTDREPYLIEGIRHSGEQTKGACLVPKRALNVMQGEVNRVLQLTSSSVIPIMYQVPRKSYRDFHADLYPDTPGYTTDLTASQWMQGKNVPLDKISLDPAKRVGGEDPIKVHRGPLSELKKIAEQMALKSASAPTYQPKIIPTKPQSVSLRPVVTKPPIVIDAGAEENGAAEDGRNGSSPPPPLPIVPTTVPPKPLPRVSRTGSISEGCDDPSMPRPIARPRTTATPIVTSVNPNASALGGGYKPRLGPKPFTPPKFNDEESFDKVFSVPAVPGGDTNGVHDPEPTPLVNDDADVVVAKPKTPSIDTKPIVDASPPPIDTKCDTSSTEEEANSNDSGYVPKTPSTAERRRLFETRTSSKENEPIEVDGFEGSGADDKVGTFERASLQRSSIAERRRMYENRSQSVQETPTKTEKAGGSPTPLRRRDSFKGGRIDEVPPKQEEKKTATVLPNNQKQQQTNEQQQQQQTKKVEPAVTPTPKRTSTVFGRVSKFRHLKGTPAHKSLHIENVRNISRQIPGECDGFQANPDRVAVPLSGPGGKIAVFELAKTGKLPDGVIPALVHGTNVMDFAWDPFDSHRLAVACDDGTIRLWLIPDGGLVEPTNTPDSQLDAHADKIYFVKFHPTASDVLASGSYDMTVRLFDLRDLAEKIVLRGHSEQIFSFAWSPIGDTCATVSKDGRIRVYEPRKSDVPIREGKGPVGTRGARVVWALDGSFVVVTGFDKVSERQIMAFRADDLGSPLNTVGLDVSPAILIPFYDEDSSTLFLTGKGDLTIYAFEITEEAPYICPLSHHRCNSLHQGLSFLPKNVCDVANVEFAKAFRLTNNTIEPLSFTVPRIKSELFQDDLFPPTYVTWKPTMTSQEWFSGKSRRPARISLCPEGMECLSGTQGHPNPSDRPKSSDKRVAGAFSVAAHPFNKFEWIADQTKSKQEQIQKSVSSLLEVNLKLEQDDMEGVDEKEWDD